jgi:hypothetical protein
VEYWLSPLHGAFRYADGVTTTGGQFNNSASYSPANLGNNGFTSPIDTIDTTVTYPAAGNNYATAQRHRRQLQSDVQFQYGRGCQRDVCLELCLPDVLVAPAPTTPGVNAYTAHFLFGPRWEGQRDWQLLRKSGRWNVYNAVNSGTDRQLRERRMLRCVP